MTSTLIETPAIAPRVRSSRPVGAVRVAGVNAQPRALTGRTAPMPAAVPAPTYAVAPTMCRWLGTTEIQDRGIVRADLAAQDGRTAGFGGAHVTTFKHSTRSGPPSCSPPA